MAASTAGARAPRIDSHQHFWRYRPETHGWIGDAMAVLKRDFLPQDLEPLLAAEGFSGCVAVQASQSLDETRFLLELAESHAVVQAVVGWFDLRADDLSSQIAGFAGRKRLRGVRHIAQDEADDGWLARADVIRGVETLGRHGLVFDILVYARQLESAIALARALPNQPFVLDHLAKPQIARGRLDPWRADVRRLAELPNVSCKLSGLVTEARWDGWTAADFRPYLDVALEAFGPDRLMFGSDWPVCLLAGSYADVAGLARGAIEALSRDEQDAILGGNAARVYGLETTTGGTP